jgi:hypothetical protein
MTIQLSSQRELERQRLEPWAAPGGGVSHAESSALTPTARLSAGPRLAHY